MINKRKITIPIVFGFGIFALVGLCFFGNKSKSMISEYAYIDRVFVDAIPQHDLSCTKEGAAEQIIYDLNPERYYFDYPDLVLGFEENQLRKVSSNLWRNNEKGEQRKIVEESRSTFSSAGPYSKNYEYSAMWQAEVPQEKWVQPHDRLWNQEYEDPAVFPVLNGNFVLYQNYHTIIARSQQTGVIKWQFTPKKNYDDGQYLMQLRSLFEPRPSYRMEVSGEYIFAELTGVLYGLKMTTAMPEELWSISLGQYTLASKPYMTDNKDVFALLVNRRGELWGVLIDAVRGAIVWDTFICTTTVVCPASDLVLTDDNTIFFVSNRGVSGGLDLRTGIIRWLFEYEMRHYTVDQVWLNPGYAGADSKRDFLMLPYTGETLDSFGDQIVFKARNSDVIYACDKKSGEVIYTEKIAGYDFLTFENGNYFVYKEGKGVFSWTQNFADKQLVHKIEKGVLRGTHFDGDGDFYCLIGPQMYYKPANDMIFYTVSISIDSDLWLVGDGNKDVLFLADKNNRFYSYQKSHKKDLDVDPLAAFIGSLDSVDFHKKKNRIMLSEIAINNQLSPQQLAKLCRNPSFVAYLGEFPDLKKRMVIDNHMYIRLPYYVQSLWQDIDIEEKMQDTKKQNLINFKRPFPQKAEESFIVCEGEGLRTVHVEGDDASFPFLFVLKNEQLIAVRKNDGVIQWALNIMGYRTNSYARICLNFAMQAKVYGTNIVFFDGINIFAIEPHRGQLIWSAAVDSLQPEHMLNYQKQIITRTNARMFDVVFLEDVIVYYQKGQLFFINPNSGLCYGRHHLEQSIITGMHAYADKCVLNFFASKKIFIFDVPTGEKIMEFDLDIDDDLAVVQQEEEKYRLYALHEMSFSSVWREPYLYFVIRNKLYQFNTVSGVMKKVVLSENVVQWDIGLVNNALIVQSPFWSLRSFDPVTLKENFTKFFFEGTYDEMRQSIFSPSTRGYERTRESQYLHIVNSKPIFIHKENGSFVLSAIHPVSGKRLWTLPITADFSHMWYVSDSVESDNLFAIVILTRTLSDSSAINLEYTRPLFLVINHKTGEYIKKITFPLAAVTTQYSHYISLSGDTLFVNENNQRLRAERIKL